MKPWKKLHLKSTIKCFKKTKICKWPEIPYSFLLIDCCVRINGQLQTVYSVVMFSHRYLDRDHINFKTFVFLAVYWSIWTSSYNTDIKVQQFLKWSLHNVKGNVFKGNAELGWQGRKPYTSHLGCMAESSRLWNFIQEYKKYLIQLFFVEVVPFCKANPIAYSHGQDLKASVHQLHNVFISILLFSAGRSSRKKKKIH